MAAGIPATDEERVRDAGEWGASLPADVSAALAIAIPAVSDAIENYLGTRLEEAARVEYPSVVRRNQRLVRLVHAPVVTGTTELRQNLSRDFTDAADDIDPATYHVDLRLGAIVLDAPLYGGAGTLRVTSTGGLGTDLDDLEANFPAVVEAATLWASEILRRRRSLTTESTGGRGGSAVSYVSLGQMPEAVKGLLDASGARRRRRFS